MCMVSAVIDYGRGIPAVQWVPQTWIDYQDIIRRLDALDKKLGEVDCDKSRKWMEAVEERLKALEKPKRKGAKRKNPRKDA